ncbi:MAG: hypothetical protein HZA03_00020 [Nitrospinae bacterium]|nr:hypothetical protein [Nitrospinota bacterium]
MFKIPEDKKNTSDSWVIVNDCEVYLYYDEPILFSGTNKLGERIIGSYVDSDYEAKFSRHYYTIVTEAIFQSFLCGGISYLSLLTQAKSFFVVDTSFDDESPNVHSVDISIVPSQELPLPNSFYIFNAIPAEKDELETIAPNETYLFDSSSVLERSIILEPIDWKYSSIANCMENVTPFALTNQHPVGFKAFALSGPHLVYSSLDETTQVPVQMKSSKGVSMKTQAETSENYYSYAGCANG